MGQYYNQQHQTDRRQELRNNLPPAEKKLWQHLKGKQLGEKFRRQHGIGVYIVDFYCARLKLVIEIDGDTHFAHEDVERDNRRTRQLLKSGIQVLRFSNTDVYESIEDVLEIIKQQFPDD